MNVGYIQFAPMFGDIKGNVAHARHLIDDTTADLLVLPELFNTGYYFTEFKELQEMAEKIPDGYTCMELYKAAKEWRCYIVAGMLEEDNGLFYNSAVLMSEEGYVGHYRKLHLFSEEKLFFAPGDELPRVYDIGKAKIGIMICFDWLFPEVMRSLALMGAQIICHPSNLVLPYCPKVMPSRCFDNRVFAITANRHGKDEKNGQSLSFIGTSQIVNPEGKIVKRALTDEDSKDVVFIDPKEADNKMVGENDIFADRRPMFYGALTASHEELALVEPIDAKTDLSVEKYDII